MKKNIVKYVVAGIVAVSAVTAGGGCANFRGPDAPYGGPGDCIFNCSYYGPA